MPLLSIRGMLSRPIRLRLAIINAMRPMKGRIVFIIEAKASYSEREND